MNLSHATLERIANEVIEELDLQCKYDSAQLKPDSTEWCVNFTGGYGQLCDDFHKPGVPYDEEVVKQRIRDYLLLQYAEMHQQMSASKIDLIHFKNFKVLRDATLPLGRFTLIVGPNGSGKSTAMEAISVAGRPQNHSYYKFLTAALRNPGEGLLGKDGKDATVTVTIDWITGRDAFSSKTQWFQRDDETKFTGPIFTEISDQIAKIVRKRLQSFRAFSFNPQELARPVSITPDIELQSNGANLAGVLDSLQSTEPDRFESLNKDLTRWLPDFDRVLLDVPKSGQKEILMRTRAGERIQASDLSDGTLFALAFLTLAYLPQPPAIVCFEEPEHGIHPRLLQEIKEGMYRLAYPEGYGDKRAPVQVIATTHSPYLLDLYKDHPEQIVIASKDEHGTRFERLSEVPHLDEFLQDAPLGDVWYSGILGGVPVAP